jgi:uncharacterized repeat protein (TIGR03803 family)
MKKLKNLFLMPMLIASMVVTPAGWTTAQIFTNLHNFDRVSEGAVPRAGLVLSGNALYGTANSGGSSGDGTIFKVNTDGTSFTNLHSFNYYDGSGPQAGLELSGNTLYGTAERGGGLNNGTVFAISTNGTDFTNIYNLDGGHASNPDAGLFLSGNTLYGTAKYGGGFSGNGTVFAVHTNSTGFTNIYKFTDTPSYPYKNGDGIYPVAGLVLSGDALYGTASGGGSSGNGTVFSVNTNGKAFKTLHSFSVLPASPNPATNYDGAAPSGSLLLSGGKLYGTTSGGGGSGSGTIFVINTNGAGFATLHNFTALNNFTNSDGVNPWCGLVLSGNTLYGTAYGGGNSGRGTVFAINTDGTGFSTLYNFTAGEVNSSSQLTNSDGAFPIGGLILSGTTVYGTSSAGGSLGWGTIFSLALPQPPPQLTITPSGWNVILTWPTNVAGFALQATTNLVSPPVWSAVFPVPVIINGQNTVTNPLSGTQSFYRLIQ